METKNRKKYLINVRAVNGELLTFRVDDYSVKDNYVEFLDTNPKTGIVAIKKFPQQNTEITEEKP